MSMLENSRRIIEKERQEIEEDKARIQTLQKQLEAKNEKIDSAKERILREANEKAREVLQEAKDIADHFETINFHQPQATIPSGSTTSNGGCYVATAVYGSYDCPEVWTLRRFRDCTLYESWYGRTFIKAYYAISPTLVKWFGKTQWFKKSWSMVLDRFVAKLNNDGVANTPYNDRRC